MYAGMKMAMMPDNDHKRIVLPANRYSKVTDVVRFVEQDYVDSLSLNDIEEDAITGILNELDPHSQYITADELKEVNESLSGNFEGIGIEFRIVEDSITVMHVISGGPSEKTGLRSGDRIIYIDDSIVAGIKLTNQDAVKKLKGPRGTKVNVDVYRPAIKGMIEFTIVRDIIPLYSVDISYMVNSTTGYIKLSRFSATTPQEVDEALERLRNEGGNKLILDLRGNVGGYLESAIKLADEFLGPEKLIVYTEGKNRPRQYAYATRTGKFEGEELVVLVDEGSASASEILAGAIQDNDRGTIIGRRSFGKGLVQQQLELSDGSAVRLTVARYYTPTGRCIQKPYTDGLDAYHDDIIRRIRNGELENQDSIRFPDSLKYVTPGGKVVYGGGGIMPDIYVPIDTGSFYAYYNTLINKGLIYQYAYDYSDRNREKLLNDYNTPNYFINRFKIDDALFDHLIEDAAKNGVPKDESGIEATRALITNLLKAYIGRTLFNNEAFYPVLNQEDKTFLMAVKELNQGK
jgi:carboxyl-terminal processing protease